MDEAAKDGPALDPRLEEVCGRVIGPGRAELAAAVGSPPVLMRLILGQGRPQVPFIEDEHLVGEIGPGGEHESFRVGARARAARRDLDGLDVGVG